MYWTSLAAAALLGQNVAAQNMLRFACSQLVVERTDPLVNPGMTYTPHLHQIVGGNSFNVTMDPSTHDLAGQSTCTSCTFKEDLSNYWTAVMFFHHKNGSYIRVPQVGNGGPQGHLVQDGGLDVYYIPSGKTTAFQKVCTQTQTLTQDNGVGLCAHLCPRASACSLVRRPTRTRAKSARATFATAAGPRQTTTLLSAERPARAATRSISLLTPAAR